MSRNSDKNILIFSPENETTINTLLDCYKELSKAEEIIGIKMIVYIPEQISGRILIDSDIFALEKLSIITLR